MNEEYNYCDFCGRTISYAEHDFKNLRPDQTYGLYISPAPDDLATNSEILKKEGVEAKKKYCNKILVCGTCELELKNR